MRNKKRMIIAQSVIPWLVTVAVIVILLFNYSSNNATFASREVEKDLIVSAERYVDEFNNELSTMTKMGISMGKIIFRYVGLENSQAVEVAETLCNDSPAYMVVFCDTRGVGYTQSGEHVFLDEYQYFNDVKDSKENTYVYTANDGITGEEAIVSYINIPETNGGKLLMYYPINNMENFENKSDLDSDIFIFIMDKDGQILEHNDYSSKFLEEDNLWTALGTSYQEEVRKMTVRIKNAVSGSYPVTLQDESRTLVYAPVNINQWAFVIGVNQHYVKVQEDKMLELTKSTLFQLIVVVGLFLAALVCVNMFSKLRNTENTKKLQEKADTDLLTGLNNKLATERKIKDFIACNPNDQSMMFVLDIDNFKKINDTMGHAFGDEVLRSLGIQIAAMFRVTDIIGRTGGDEFIIFLKNIKEDVLLKKEAEKVARFFHDFKTGEYVKYSATASIGVAVFPEDGKDFETLYKAADSALYMAKERGKNQLAFYHDRIEAVVIRK